MDTIWNKLREMSAAAASYYNIIINPEKVVNSYQIARSLYSMGLGPSGQAADLEERADTSASGARDSSGETPA